LEHEVVLSSDYVDKAIALRPSLLLFLDEKGEDQKPIDKKCISDARKIL
jgi:hypothetical protein